MIAQGVRAPGIDAASSAGRFTLADVLSGGPVVLFFYVRADTPG